LKIPPTKGPADAWRVGSQWLRRRWRRGAAVLAVLAYGVIAFAGGAAFLAYLRPALEERSGATTPRRALVAALRAPGNYLRALTGGVAVQTLAIDIGFKQLHALHEQRAQALETGVLPPSASEEVPADVTLAGQTVPVKLRLEGEGADAFRGEKWSMRIAAKRGHHLFGMRRLMLEPPRLQGFQAERFFLDHLREEGVLAPRYFFVDVRINGDDIGLMAVREHYAKELLESQQRRDSVILRFDDTPYVESVRTGGDGGPFDNYRNARIEPFSAGRVERHPTLSADARIATGLLRGFVEGTLPAGETFDLETTGRFLAVAEVWRSEEALRWNNLRFYFNPLTARLEPVGFVGDLHRPYTGPGLVTQSQPFSKALLGDDAVRAAFSSALRRIAGRLAEGSLVEWLQKAERDDLARLHREYPFRSAYDFGPVVARAEALRSVALGSFALFDPAMDGADRRYPQVLRAVVERDERGPTLVLANSLPVPVTVTELRFGAGEEGSAADFAKEAGVRLPIRLAPTAVQTAPTPVRIAFQPPPRTAVGLPEIEGVAVVQGQTHRYPFRAVAYPAPLRRSPLPRATLSEVLGQHPWLRHDAEAGALVARPGTWEVEGSLVLPPGLGLRIPPGTTLRFGTGEGLIATGPLLFEGRAEAPIRLEGPAAADPRSLWSGVAVLGSERPSRWEHVQVVGTGGFDRTGWSLAAGVVFRRAEVSMEHCRFAGNRTEDALNIIRSRFALRDVEIVDTDSDALDADFSEGRIEGGRISRIGGDGIDVSGSEVRLSGVQLSEIRDKAVSVGEQSRVTANGLSISRSGTGFVSKDRSWGEIRDSEITEIAHTALMAYVKKPEYGPAELEASGNLVTRVQRLAMAQTGSRMVVDGKIVPEEDIDVDRLYDEGYMRK
jgi:hypothetical protein